jgi:hypothetical protein
MNELAEETRFPNGDPTAFQVAAVQRFSHLLREHGMEFDEFRLNLGAKRGFWTSFMLNGREHILTVYPDELNILADRDLYENYLRREFKSKDILIESFARRLTRLLQEGIWELPEEGRESPIRRAIASLFRGRTR